MSMLVFSANLSRIITVEYFKSNSRRSTYRSGKNFLCQGVKASIVCQYLCVTRCFSIVLLFCDIPYTSILNISDSTVWTLGVDQGRKGKLCVSWRAVKVNPGEPEVAQVFFPSERLRYMLSHINLSWLILQKIWEQFPRVLVKMRGMYYLTIILSWRQSVCLLALL